MKLNEIVLVKKDLSQHGIDLSKFDFDKSEQMANIGFTTKEGDITLWKTPATNKPSIFLISLKLGDKNISYIYGGFIEHGDHKFFRVDRAWTDPKYRGKRISTLILYHLKDEFHMRLISDRDLTPSGLGTWRSIGKSTNVYVYDSVTGKNISWTTEIEQELFIPDDDYLDAKVTKNKKILRKANRYYLVTESETKMTMPPPSSTLILRRWNAIVDSGHLFEDI